MAGNRLEMTGCVKEYLRRRNFANATLFLYVPSVKQRFGGEGDDDKCICFTVQQNSENCQSRVCLEFDFLWRNGGILFMYIQTLCLVRTAQDTSIIG